MMEDTPLKDFQGKAGDFLIRLNLVSGQVSDVSHYHEGLSIYAANYVEQYCFEQFYNIDNIPPQALTIFFDLQTFFDYIVENHANPHKVNINKNGMVVSNIIKARNAERRQEVVLEMTRKPLVLPLVKEVDNPEALSSLKAQNLELKEALQHLRKELDDLVQINRRVQETVKNLQEKMRSDEQTNHSKTMEQQRNTLILAQNQEAFKEFMNNCKAEQRYMIDVVNQLKRDLATERQDKEELKEQIRELRRLLKQKGNVTGSINSLSNKDIMGQKVEVSIDRSSPFISKYIINSNIIQKVDGDETRFQIVGNQVLGKVSRCYFEVNILNLQSNGLIIGVVSQQRRGQRHSYDQKECVCYDGTGKIFQAGKKWPVPVKFQAGQVVKVMLDLERLIVRWFISYTQVGSALLPEALRNSKLVPYLQLNEVKDKISLNQ